MRDEVDDGSFAFCALLNQTICGDRGCYPSISFPANCGNGEIINAETAASSIAVGDCSRLCIVRQKLLSLANIDVATLFFYI